MKKMNITINIDRQWIETAHKFAQEHHLPERRQRIFLNTLSVYGVNRYFQWSDTSTDLEDSYSWHPITRNLYEWADLKLPDYGRVICLPILAEKTTVQLPQDIPENFVGYIIVTIINNLEDLEIIGFLNSHEAFNLEFININQIAPIEDIFDEFFLLSESLISIEEELLCQTQNQSPVAQYLAEILAPENFTEIVNHLNKIYYQYPQEEWLTQGQSVLRSLFPNPKIKINLPQKNFITVKENTSSYQAPKETKRGRKQVDAASFGELQEWENLVGGFLKKIQEVRDKSTH